MTLTIKLDGNWSSFQRPLGYFKKKAVKTEKMKLGLFRKISKLGLIRKKFDMSRLFRKIFWDGTVIPQNILTARSYFAKKKWPGGYFKKNRLFHKISFAGKFKLFRKMCRLQLIRKISFFSLPGIVFMNADYSGNFSPRTGTAAFLVFCKSSELKEFP